MNLLVKCTAAALLVSCATTSTSGAERGKKRPEPADGGPRAEAISHFLTAEIYKHRGDFRTWLNELQDAAETDRASIELQIRLMSAYRLSNNYHRAIRLGKQTLEDFPNSVVLHIWLGKLYLENGDIDESVATFEQALAIDPTSTLALEALARLKEETNDLVAQVELYEKLVTIAPDSAGLHYELGTSLYELGALEQAKAAFERALEIQPHMPRAEFRAAIVTMDLNDYPQATLLLRAFLDKYPNHARARANLASSLARERDYAAAIDELTAVIESAEVEPQHHLYRMYLMLRVDEIPDASLAIAPSSAPILGSLMSALVRKRSGEPYERLVNGLDLIEGDLDDECNRYLNGLLHAFGPDDAGRAIDDELAALIEAGHGTRALEIIRGRALMSRERSDEAASVMLGVIERYGGDKWTHYYLASILDGLDKHDQAEEHLHACLRLDPKDSDAMNFLGYMYAEENMKLDEAEELLNRALEIDPENGFYLDSLGWIYYRLGRGEEAVEYIERAIRNMAGDDAILRDHLGDAYLMIGDSERAVQEWRRAHRLDPELEGVQEKIGRHSE